MTNDRRDTQIGDALSRLRETTAVPPVDPERQAVLLSAFDAHWARPRRAVRRGAWVWTAAAASVAIAFALSRFVVIDAPGIAPAIPSATIDIDIDTEGFVPWPGAHALPPLESGELRRVELPRSALAALGLSAPPSGVSIVEADVVVGQDGLARAIRLVHQQ